ncbi:hypothetical protein COU17_00810 [Candidatus Kaiserbacteria bacterium CG10_big_fil_rev_8_21_14_0_10_49_17]|uniref:DUF4189 domain-containing protein n=1 Tax=Candidatus Kaiserbacteria bacterium CG10_big_fil_rev_8_21_14_0_10_49_17 TaxID=1974609 RepID=A0A2M6WEW7_9BACT|nr:MAG: hypothetical protein COU17_00810 [Candidatus Kaiserbacteria bacterium CG10_big_fil_rev_8_21_14_0_10_49_17]
MAIVLSTLTATATPARADCYRPNCWGAIAFNRYTHSWGRALNYPNMWSARNAANYRCSGSCIVIHFRNACGAVYVSGNGYGWATRAYHNSAKSAAYWSCRQRNGYCSFLLSGCTARQF